MLQQSPSDADAVIDQSPFKQSLQVLKSPTIISNPLNIENFAHILKVFDRSNLVKAAEVIGGTNQALAAIVSGQSLEQIKALLPSLENEAACEKFCDERDLLNNSLTFWAVAAHKLDILKHLIDNYQFGPATKGVGQLTLIHLSVLVDAYDIFKYLLTDLKRQDCLNVMYKNIDSQEKEMQWKPFHASILTGKVNWLESAYQQVGVVHNIPWQVLGLGNVLHLAILANQPSSLLFLLAKLGNSAQSCLQGLTETGTKLSVLSYAAALGREECLNLLLIFYRTNQAVREQRDQAFLVAFCYAIKYKQIKSIRLLLLFGVSSAVTIMPGDTEFSLKTPLQIASISHGERSRIYNQIETDITKNLAREYKNPEISFNKVENLVLRGGGVRGVAYVFGIQSLFDCLAKRAANEGHSATVEEIQAGVVRYIGASAGAITAAFLAIGCTPEELMEELIKADLKLFVEGLDTEKLLSEGLWDKFIGIVEKLKVEPSLWSPLKTLHSLLDNQGLCSGDAFLRHMEDRLAFRLAQKVEQLEAKIRLLEDKKDAAQQSNIEQLKVKLTGIQAIFSKKKELKYLTFGELAQLVNIAPETFKHLHTIATLLPNQEQGIAEKIESFHSKQSMPMNEGERSFEDVLVVDAVRASMSFPGVFEPYALREMQPGAGDDVPSVYHPERKYMDGGALKNLPIEECDRLSCLFNLSPGDPDKVMINPHTLALSLYKEEKVPVAEKKTLPAAAADVPAPVFVSRIQVMKRAVVSLASNLRDTVKHTLDTVNPKRVLTEVVTDKLSKESEKILKSQAGQLLKAIISCYEEAETLIANYQGTRTGRVIDIGDRGIGTLEFNLSPADIRQLSESAIQTVYPHFGFAPSPDIINRLEQTIAQLIEKNKLSSEQKTQGDEDSADVKVSARAMVQRRRLPGAAATVQAEETVSEEEACRPQ